MADDDHSTDGEPTGGEDGKSGQSFTQADVDKIVRERVQRERAKYADYDDLKAKAGQAKTLEDRIADLETKGNQSDQRALRAEIAAEFGISTKRGVKGEPSDADLFLTGTDEDTLRSQAKRLTEREADRKKQGGVAPREGTNQPPQPNELRGFTRQLFGRND